MLGDKVSGNTKLADIYSDDLMDPHSFLKRRDRNDPGGKIRLFLHWWIQESRSKELLRQWQTEEDALPAAVLKYVTISEIT